MSICRLLAAGCVLLTITGCRRVGFGELPFDCGKAQPTVDSILNGKLAPSALGVVTLPGSSSASSIDGKAYVTTSQPNAKGILFVTWIGKGSNLHGYFYSTAPLTAFGLQPDAYGKDSIEIVGPSPAPDPGSPKLDAARVRVEVFPTDQPAWHLVSYTLD